MQSFADKSADAALVKEQELTQKELNIDQPLGIEVSSDAAWQKRGSQRSYNSLSGIASAIGKKTKKIVHFNSRFKKCRICWYASKHNQSPQQHQCQLNWQGSAKAMEPDMFVQMVNDTAKKGVPIAKVAGDDDHTGINRVCQEGNTNIEKESDKNHVHKNITKKLFNLQKTHKTLSQKVILSVTKNFNYMLQQNSGNPDKIAIGLKAVIEHMYGNHSYCQEWCHFLKDPEKYRHRNLPYGKDLTDESLHTALSNVFTNLDANKLAFLSSTQANESFNNTVASKAPKGRHYSDSLSLQYRLCASVGQKNEGYGYIAGVHKDAGLSPGASAKRCGMQLDKQTEWKREHQGSVQSKCRHLALRAERAGNEWASETREGDTYVSNIGQDKRNPDIVAIPSAADNIKEITGDMSYVMVDLETGGLARTCDILQISAVHDSSEFIDILLQHKIYQREHLMLLNSPELMINYIMMEKLLIL